MLKFSQKNAGEVRLTISPKLTELSQKIGGEKQNEENNEIIFIISKDFKKTTRVG